MEAWVIGAGPAGLMAAEALAAAGLSVVVAEAKPSAGRKLLMAGKSGLNLTKDEPEAAFRAVFDAEWLAPILHDFGPRAAMAWAEGLGQPLFTGSSGRVFPVAMKASPLLRAWLARLGGQGVALCTGWRWTGWAEGGDVGSPGAAAEAAPATAPRAGAGGPERPPPAGGSAGRPILETLPIPPALAFATPQGARVVRPAVVVLALGGASWPRLGSDGGWTGLLAVRGVALAPFRPANMGLRVDWSAHMAPHLGQPVKGARLTAGDLASRGEFVLSARGLEGGGIYAVSRAVREGAALAADLFPDLTGEALAARIARGRPGESMASRLRRIGLSPAAAALAQEMGRPLPAAPPALAARLKALPIAHLGPRPLAEAISSAGGIRAEALTPGLMLRVVPGVFAAGEMLDWEAPTGGYLLTACLATGRAAGRAAAAWAKAR